MVRKRVDEEETKRKKKLEAILQQFDIDVSNRMSQMLLERDIAVKSAINKLKLARLKMPEALATSKWESLYPLLCGDESSAGSQWQMFLAPPPPAPGLVTSQNMLEADCAVASDHVKRSHVTGDQSSSSSSSQRAGGVMFTPMSSSVPPSGWFTGGSMVASTPMVRPKFDPSTALKQVPVTARKNRPNEVLMSIQGSPVVLERAGVAGTGQQKQGAGEVLAHALQAVDNIDQLDNIGRQAALRLKRKLDSLVE